MGDFFRGWQRKVGVVTLLMASVFMGWWIRSPLNKDSVELECGNLLLTFASNQNGLWWVTSELPGGFYQPAILRGKNQTFARPGHRSPFSDDPFGHLTRWSWVTEQRWDWGGFHYGRYFDERTIGGIRLTFRIIPHWSITMLLTLLSAVLLLSKSRKTPPK
jgi:hypothetical protein